MIFFTDIDNTLIFSEKRKPQNSICVEYKDGYPLTFMSEKSIELYNKIRKKMLVIPVTTRSKEQFMRIEIIKDAEFAIVSNGAKLLLNGEEDNDWTNYFASYTNYFHYVFEKCQYTLKENFPNSHIRMADNTFMYSRLDENVNAAFMILSEVCKKDKVNISASHGKIYIIPKEISKSNAIKRFCQKYNINDKTISAGDSLMDIDMLLSTDKAIAMRGELEKELTNNQNIIFTNSFNDTEFVLQTILNMCNN